MFLHYHIAYFPGPFENIIKELKEASDVEARRGLAGDGRISAFPWARALTQAHTTQLCSALDAEAVQDRW